MSISLQERQRQIVAKLQRHKPLNECLCGGGEPKLGYNHGPYPKGGPKLPYPCQVGAYYEAFTLYCAYCGYRSGVFMDVQASISAWQRHNRPDDIKAAERWLVRYEEQNQERDSLAEAA